MAYQQATITNVGDEVTRAVKESQESVFLGSEGNAWFQRNRARLDERVSTDWPLKLIADFKIQPKKVLEIGCSNARRLAEIKRLYQCDCVGIDPSHDAILDGQKRFSGIELHQGIVSKLPLPNTEQFDIVIVNFVLHWVSRDSLLSAVSEIDRCVSDGGLLIIGDFLPDYPSRNPYHHLLEKNIYTYKQDYSQLFLSSALYQIMTRSIYDHDEPSQPITSFIPSNRRAVCTLLLKSTQDYYANVSHK